MGKLTELLARRRTAILKGWLDRVFATYPAKTAKFLKNQTDQFANPVGNRFRVSCEAILDAMISGFDPHQICQDLDNIIEIRAIQQFSPSQVLSFILLLKDVLNEEFEEELQSLAGLSELRDLEKKIDQILLFAIDILVRRREQVYELRVNEMKRSVSTIVKRANRCSAEPELVLDQSHCKIETH